MPKLRVWIHRDSEGKVESITMDLALLVFKGKIRIVEALQLARLIGKDIDVPTHFIINSDEESGKPELEFEIGDKSVEDVIHYIKDYLTKTKREAYLMSRLTSLLSDIERDCKHLESIFDSAGEALEKLAKALEETSEALEEMSES